MKALTLEIKKNIYILESDIQNPNHLAGYIDSELNEHKVKFICKGSEWVALKEFFEKIESQGYYWGNNPLNEPQEYKDWIEKDKYPGFFAFEKCKTYQEAELKTFDLNKTLIFQIL